MGRINPLIALGIPTWGKVSVTWAMHFRGLGGTLGSEMTMFAVEAKPIAAARNELMERAIASDADFLFMLGDDVIPQGDAIQRLWQRMVENPDVHLATGVYWTKTWPALPYLWKDIQRGPYLDWKHGEFFPIEYAGCDCLLIRMSDQMKALGPDWFTTEWVWDADQAGPDRALNTEDFPFYTKCREAGLRLWVDTAVQCGHEDRQSRNIFAMTLDLPQAGAHRIAVPGTDNLPAGATDIAPRLRIADLGSGVESPFFGYPDEVELIRFDADGRVRPDYRCDIRHLPVPDGYFDVVHSRHALEHFGRAETPAILREWARALRVGGELRLSVPNILAAFDWIAKMDAGAVIPNPYPFWQLYGEQADDRDYHRNGFTERRLRLLLEEMGIWEDIEVQADNFNPDVSEKGLNLFARARKVRHATPPALVPAWDRIAAVEGELVGGIRPLPTNGHSALPPEAADVLARTGGT